MLTLSEVTEVRWTPELRKVNSQYPTAVRSKNWPEIAKLANSGQVDQAMELASRGLINPDIRRRTAIARRMRIERKTFFSRLNFAKKELATIFSSINDSIEPVILKKAGQSKNIKFINDKIDEVIVDMRRELNKWVRVLLRDSTRLALKNSGQALLPIFKANQESFDEIVRELELFDQVALIEVRLGVGIKASFANRVTPTVAVSSDKWAGVMDKIMRDITRKTSNIFKPSERIWEVTQRARLDMRRIVVNGIAQGKNPTVIAREVKRFISPQVTRAAELGTSAGPGVYRSPFRNALRVARTEANRAYSHASAEFAKDKPWIEGIQITLSPVHSATDICDQWAAKVVSADKFKELVPFHPHCMCYATYKLKDNIFEEAA